MKLRLLGFVSSNMRKIIKQLLKGIKVIIDLLMINFSDGNIATIMACWTIVDFYTWCITSFKVIKKEWWQRCTLRVRSSWAMGLFYVVLSIALIPIIFGMISLLKLQHEDFILWMLTFGGAITLTEALRWKLAQLGYYQYKTLKAEYTQLNHYR